MSPRVSGLLVAVRRRLRVAWASETVQLAAPWLAGAALVLVIAARYLPWTWPEPAALVAPFAAIVAIVVWGAVQRVPQMVVARATDRGLQTKDAFASALEFSPPSDDFTSRIHARADHLAAGARAGEAVPLHLRWKRIVVAALITALAVSLAMIANPQDEARATQQAEKANIAQTAKELDDEAVRLEALGTDAKAAAERLKKLAEELRKTDSLNKADEALRKAADELQRQVKPDALATKAATKGLERSLSTQPLGDRGDLPAAEQLEAAAASLDTMTPEQQKALADRLDKLAETQEVGAPDTAAALKEAAKAARAGDVATAKAALGEAANAQKSASSDAAAQQAAGDAAKASRDAAKRLGERSGRGAGSGKGNGTGSGTGKGQGSGSGSGQGSGSGSGQGKGGSGGGGGGGSPSGDVGGGGGGGGSAGRGGQGQGTGTGGGNAGEEPNTATIFDPVTAGAGEEGTVGNGGVGDTETVGKGDGPTQAGSQRVPLADALTTYQNQATSALDAAEVPPSVRALVVAYFDALQGRK